MAEKGYDPVFGARPLKRFLQRNVETKLARALIAGDVAEGSDLKFATDNDELALNHTSQCCTTRRRSDTASGSGRAGEYS